MWITPEVLVLSAIATTLLIAWNVLLIERLAKKSEEIAKVKKNVGSLHSDYRDIHQQICEPH